MARIRQVTLSPDLFGDKARGVSLPDITWATYAEVVRLTAKKFGSPLWKITREVLIETISARNRASRSTISLKTSRMTIIVTAVQGNDVTVGLFFDDLKAPREVMNAILRDVTARARCLEFAVKDGLLVGHVTLPAKVYSFPKPTQDTREVWSRLNQDVDAEEMFLNQAGRRIAR